MRWLNLSLCLLLADTVCGEQKHTAELVRIGELNEAYVTAFNAHDAKKIATLFTVDGDFTLLTGESLHGREQVAAGHASFFTSNSQAKISGQQTTVRFIRPDVLLATGKWRVENGPPQYPSSGIWATVVANQDGKWKYEAMRLMIPASPSTK